MPAVAAETRTLLGNRSACFVGSAAPIALEDAEEAAILPGWGKAHYRIGTLREAAGDALGALQSLDRACALLPEAAEAAERRDRLRAAHAAATAVPADAAPGRLARATARAAGCGGGDGGDSGSGGRAPRGHAAARVQDAASRGVASVQRRREAADEAETAAAGSTHAAAAARRGGRRRGRRGRRLRARSRRGGRRVQRRSLRVGAGGAGRAGRGCAAAAAPAAATASDADGAAALARRGGGVAPALLSNRAACALRLGDAAACVDDCDATIAATAAAAAASAAVAPRAAGAAYAPPPPPPPFKVRLRRAGPRPAGAYGEARRDLAALAAMARGDAERERCARCRPRCCSGQASRCEYVRVCITGTEEDCVL